MWNFVYIKSINHIHNSAKDKRKDTKSVKTHRILSSAVAKFTDLSWDGALTISDNSISSTSFGTREFCPYFFEREEPCALLRCGFSVMSFGESSNLRRSPQTKQEPRSVGLIDVQFRQCHCRTEAFDPIFWFYMLEFCFGLWYFTLSESKNNIWHKLFFISWLCWQAYARSPSLVSGLTSYSIPRGKF